MEQSITLADHHKQEYPQMLCIVRFKKSLCIVLLLLFAEVLCAQARMTPSEIMTTSSLRNYESVLLNYFGIDSADKFAYLVTSS